MDTVLAHDHIGMEWVHVTDIDEINVIFEEHDAPSIEIYDKNFSRSDSVGDLNCSFNFS